MFKTPFNYRIVNSYMNSFSVDSKGERREMVAKIINQVEPRHSGGASSERYFFNGRVYKVPASKESLFKPEEVEKNAEILSRSNVDFADTVLGVYDLSELGYASRTPVVIQEQAEMTFRDSLSDGKATKKTWKLFKRALDVADRAIESEIVLDGSLTNYGLFGNRVLFLDIQDGNSVEEYTVEKFEDMYESLANSMSRAGADRSEVLEKMDSKSRFYTR